MPHASSVHIVVRASTEKAPASAETETSTARRTTIGEWISAFTIWILGYYFREYQSTGAFGYFIRLFIHAAILVSLTNYYL